MTVTSPSPATPRSTRPDRERATRLFLAHVMADVRANLRVPEFLVGAVTVPILLYVMFGSSTEVGDTLPGGTSVAAMMAAAFAAYGIVSLAIFTFGVDVAQERGKGWLRTRRVTPLPTWMYFGSRIVMAVAFAVIILAGITLVAVTLGDVVLPVTTWVSLSATLLTGAVTFSTFGFAIAWLARPRAASAIGNLLFLPLSFASGFFIPLAELPPLLRNIAPWLPTYHYGLLVWGRLAEPGDVIVWTGAHTVSADWVQIAWMAGSFVLFGCLALIGWHRDGDMTPG